MSWSAQRQLIAIAILAVLILVPLSFIGYKTFVRPATCFDGNQNQDEVGVDCGGACSLMCKSQVNNPIVSWKRLFLVGGGVYNAVMYVENPNPNAGAKKVGYRLRVYNTENISVYERRGSTVIPANRSVPIVEAGISLGDQEPTRIDFSFDSDITWYKEESKTSPLSAKEISLVSATSSPKLSALIQNDDVVAYSHVETVAILYDEKGNAVGASRTYIDTLPKGSSVPVIFTWPQPFSAVPARIEVIPKLFTN